MFLYLCICVKRRHYFVVVWQLSGALVSKLPRAPQLPHRKSDCRLFTHFPPYPRGAYGTAHKKGVEQIELVYCSATPALYGICSTASQFESPSGRYYFVVVCQLSAAYVSKLPRTPQLPHRKSDCRLFTHFSPYPRGAYGTAHKKGVEQIDVLYCSATPALYGICSTASQFESLSRRHYFVVMCQLSGALTLVYYPPKTKSPSHFWEGDFVIKSYCKAQLGS